MSYLRHRLTGLLLLLLVAACRQSPAGSFLPLATTPTPAPTPTLHPTRPPAPTLTPAPTPDLTALLDDPTLGLRLRYPAEWQTAQEPGFIILASQAELLDSPDPGEEGGVAFVIVSRRDSLPNHDPLVLTAIARDTFFAGEETEPEILQEPLPDEINGLPAATMVLQTTGADGRPIILFLGAVVGPDTGLLLGATTLKTTQALFTPIFRAILASVELRAPAPTPTPTVSAPGVAVAAGRLQYGEVVTATLAANLSQGWVFQAAAGDVVDISVASVADRFDLLVDVLDADGQSILPTPIDPSPGEAFLSGLFFQEAGAYTVAVTGGADGDYVIRVKRGLSLAYGETVAGAIPDLRAVTLSFMGQAGDMVDVIVNETGGNLDVVLEVRDSAGASLTGEVDRNFVSEQVRGLILPADGVYFITLRGFASTVGSFDLSLTRVGPP